MCKIVNQTEEVENVSDEENDEAFRKFVAGIPIGIAAGSEIQNPDVGNMEIRCFHQDGRVVLHRLKPGEALTSDLPYTIQALGQLGQHIRRIDAGGSPTWRLI